MLGTVNRGGGIDTAPIEIVDLGPKGPYKNYEQVVPDEFMDQSKYIVLNVVLKSNTDGALEFFDVINGWKKAEVLPSIKHIKASFDTTEIYKDWHVCLIVARIG